MQVSVWCRGCTISCAMGVLSRGCCCCHCSKLLQCETFGLGNLSRLFMRSTERTELKAPLSESSGLAEGQLACAHARAHAHTCMHVLQLPIVCTHACSGGGRKGIVGETAVPATGAGPTVCANGSGECGFELLLLFGGRRSSVCGNGAGGWFGALEPLTLQGWVGPHFLCRWLRCTATRTQPY